MTRWSKIRYKLENEYLADVLRGHIQYFVTTYSYSPDHEGRACIRLDGKEILQGNYYNQFFKTHLYPKDEKYKDRMKMDNPFTDDVAINLGLFDQRSFYSSFKEFENQSIEKSLKSENTLVRIFALLDRRVGKRRLKYINTTINDESEIIKMFYYIRCEKEKIYVI